MNTQDDVVEAGWASEALGSDDAPAIRSPTKKGSWRRRRRISRSGEGFPHDPQAAMYNLLIEKSCKHSRRGNTYIYLNTYRTKDSTYLELGTLDGASCEEKATEQLQTNDSKVVHVGSLAGVVISIVLQELHHLDYTKSSRGPSAAPRTRLDVEKKRIIEYALDRWIGFCALKPWNTDGKLKRRWQRRLDEHMQRRKLGISQYWRDLTGISKMEMLIEDAVSLLKCLELVSWRTAAIFEAAAVGYFILSWTFEFGLLIGILLSILIYQSTRNLEEHDFWAADWLPAPRFQQDHWQTMHAQPLRRAEKMKDAGSLAESLRSTHMADGSACTKKPDMPEMIATDKRQDTESVPESLVGASETSTESVPPVSDDSTLSEEVQGQVLLPDFFVDSFYEIGSVQMDMSIDNDSGVGSDEGED